MWPIAGWAIWVRWVLLAFMMAMPFTILGSFSGYMYCAGLLCLAARASNDTLASNDSQSGNDSQAGQCLDASPRADRCNGWAWRCCPWGRPQVARIISVGGMLTRGSRLVRPSGWAASSRATPDEPSVWFSAFHRVAAGPTAAATRVPSTRGQQRHRAERRHGQSIPLRFRSRAARDRHKDLCSTSIIRRCCPSLQIARFLGARPG